MKMGESGRISTLRAQRDFAVGLVGSRDMNACQRLILDGVLGLLGGRIGCAYQHDPELGGMARASCAGACPDLQDVFDRLVAGLSEPRRRSGCVIRCLTVSEFDVADRAALLSGDVGLVVVIRTSPKESPAGWLIAALSGEEIPGEADMRGVSGFVSYAYRLLESVRTRQIRLDAAHELQLAAKGAGVATWEVDLIGRRVLLSERAGKIQGIGSDCPHTPREALASVFPADRRDLLGAIRRAIRSGSVISHEFRSATGTRWIGIDVRVYRTPAAIMLGVSRDVTAHKRRKSGLAELEARLKETVGLRTRELDLANARLDSELASIRMALDGSGAGAWHLDVLTGAVRLDAACCEIYGLPGDENLTLERMIGRVHPDSRGMLFSRLSETLMPHGESDWDHEFLIDHPTRGKRWLSGRGRVFRDVQGRALEMAGINLDITEIKESEGFLRGWNAELERQVTDHTRELRESETKFKTLAEAIADGVVVSQSGVILDLNTQIADMFGYTPEEVRGRHVADFVAPESIGDVAASLQSNRDDRFEWTGLRKDGTRIAVESRAKIRHLDGSDIRIGVVRDLTESKRIESEISSLRGELEQSRKLSLMGEVSAGIVHQISQPLSAAGGNLAALRSLVAPCANSCCNVAELVDVATSSVASMRDIIAHMRKVAGPRMPVFALTQINQVISDVLPLLQVEADSRHLVVHLKPGGELPEILADVSQVSQLFAYLVRGAMENAGQSGGAGWIEIASCTNERGEVVLCVRHPLSAPPDGGPLDSTAAPDSTRRWLSDLTVRFCRMVAVSHHGRLEEIIDHAGQVGGYRAVFPPADHHTKV